MNELAAEVINLTASTSSISYLPLPEDDPLIREPDISRAKDVLDWTPCVERTEGMAATIADIRERV
jgi:dTDP-glucose 4,6-dehydratase